MRTHSVLLLLTTAAIAAAQVAPAPGSASVRLQSSWGQFRTAAADLLGWQVTVPSGAFGQLTFSEAAAKVDALGLAFIEGASTQIVSAEIPKYLDYHLTPDEITAVKNRLRALSLKMPAYQIESISADPRKLFEFAKSLGVETIIAPANLISLADLDKLAAEVGINVAIHGRDHKVLEGLSKRIGLNSDALIDRLLVLNPRDPASVSKLLREMYRAETKPVLIAVAPASLDAFEKAIHPVMTDRVYAIAKTMPIRGPEKLTAEMRQQIEAAAPKQAIAKPKKPRKLLVLDLNIGWPGHATIPNGNLAVELMAKNTGAFEPIFSNDLDNLKYPKIRQFDAIFLNSTVGQVFVDPEIRKALVRFVREGGGLGGVHGASYTSLDWPEFTEMLGAGEGPHRVEQATLKVDDPNSPLTAPFDRAGFAYEDEFYRFYANGPYSRDRLHVLLSIDTTKTDMVHGRPLPRGSRPDNDYGLSWIRSYGKGRVFFCAFGHTPGLFTTPKMAQHVFAGIQFILGDLAVDTTPSAKLIK
jgi:type 1 glutamine amidotransferase